MVNGSKTYKIMFSNLGTNLTLFINPEELEISQPGTNEVQDVVALGKVNVPGLRALQELDIKDLLCISRPGQRAIDVATTLQKFQAAQAPLELTINSELRRFINAGGASLWLIENIKVSERSGEEGDFYLEMKLKQYKNYTVRRYTVSKTQEPERVVTKPADKTYTVQPGDSLWLIAQKILGSGDRWQELYKANTARIANPSLIHPGQVFIVPTR